MYGAIIGDMIGAPYEFDRGSKTKDFVLFNDDAQFTDDSVMTIVIAEALMDSDDKSDDEVKKAVIRSMQEWGRKYPHAGYGGMFSGWLREKNPKPYGSFGNGSAMRVSAAGWLYDNIDDTRKYARLSAEVTHNHPEGIKGAEATASAIFMARNGKSKEEIQEYIVKEFGYDLSRTCDEIRPTYHHVETCQETVPEAITAFLEGIDFEDVIRTAVSLGGDCDTLTCIAGGIAEAFYEIPEVLCFECRNRLGKDMIEVLDRFDERIGRGGREFHDPFLDGNEIIEEAIAKYYENSCRETVIGVLDAIRKRMHEEGHFMFPVKSTKMEEGQFFFRSININDDEYWQVAFTSPEEYKKGESSEIIFNFIDISFKGCLTSDSPGIIINPWGQYFMMSRELMQMLFDADGDIEYVVPDDPITPELLEDGTFLKRALEICARNKTQLNMIKLLKLLRDSWVWIPCNAIMSESDYAAFEKMVMEAKDGEGLDSLVGQSFVAHDETRMVPDILQNGDGFFFPVFTSDAEMGEYGNGFSKLEKHFMEAMILARNNEKNVKGIVINAFSEPFFIPRELFDLVASMESSFETKEAE